MPIVLPPNLEMQLREIARGQGRDVQSLLDDPRFGEVLREALRHAPTGNGTAEHTNGANSHTPANATPSQPDAEVGIDDESFSKPSARHPLRGTVTKYIDPFEPAIDPDEWEVMR